MCDADGNRGSSVRTRSAGAPRSVWCHRMTRHPEAIEMNRLPQSRRLISFEFLILLLWRPDGTWHLLPQVACCRLFFYRGLCESGRRRRRNCLHKSSQKYRHVMPELIQKSDYLHPLMSSRCRNVQKLQTLAMFRVISLHDWGGEGRAGALSSHRRLTRRWELTGGRSWEGAVDALFISLYSSRETIYRVASLLPECFFTRPLCAPAAWTQARPVVRLLRIVSA